MSVCAVPLGDVGRISAGKPTCLECRVQEEHLWNYAPDSGDSCSGTTEPFSAAELPFVQSTNATFGSTYLKVR